MIVASRKQKAPNVSPLRLMAGTAIPFAVAIAALLGPGCGSKSGTLYSANATAASRGIPAGTATLTQVERGRYLVIAAGCADCHNRGVDNPSDPHWLAGFIDNPAGQGKFQIGPWTTFAANLTPDMTTGIGMHSDRQIFNALRYGLDPMDTADVVITGTTPGSGNFPSDPHYLAPPMPWPAIRNYSDDDLWAIIAYIKHGIKPVNNAVPDIVGPPTTFASFYTGLPSITDFPQSNEAFNP